MSIAATVVAWTCFVIWSDSFPSTKMPQYAFSTVEVRTQLCYNDTMYSVRVERRFIQEYRDGKTLIEQQLSEWTPIESRVFDRRQGKEYDPKPPPAK